MAAALRLSFDSSCMNMGMKAIHIMDFVYKIALNGRELRKLQFCWLKYGTI